MNLGIAFEPLPPLPLLAAAIALGALVAGALLLTRSRGSFFRALAIALGALALANPSLTREDRDPLTSVFAVVVDRSASQRFGERTKVSDNALAALRERLATIAGLELRIVEAGGENDGDGTRLFGALSAMLSDVPPDRIAGAVLITDGRVHDVPNAAYLGFDAPVHALITGVEGERDRRVALTSTPRFGIVGQRQAIGFRIEDEGIARGSRVNIVIRRDGEIVNRTVVTAGNTEQVSVEITHPGANIVEIEAEPLDGELTLLNNKAALTVEGVREKLRVLLVSGEPHSGERTWRNLLKSDANVDLVHFTILRPPEKQDGTPIQELSLIAFPTRELFQQKIKEFHLIIFDRYAQQGVLPLIYFDNIVEYVRTGGALLIAAGPDYAGRNSVWRTPLEAILPAAPTGTVTEAAYRAGLTDDGKRHPVTRALPGSESTPPKWSRWFRAIDAKTSQGTALMNGPNDSPLLVLSRHGEGRVALLLSDHIWLWARGYEGGGPHLDLLRRLSHWLMKQPELEEERLVMFARGNQLQIERRTMGDSAEPVTVTAPSGGTQIVKLDRAEPGIFRGVIPAGELGLFRATDGKLTALVNVGPLNPREYMEVTSTREVLLPVANATGGGVLRLADLSGNAPRVVAIRTGERYFGPDWIGVKQREASVVRGLGLFPVFAGLSGLLILLAGISAAWAREGR
ncbi:MAG: hypothetical protein KF794_11840 [Xanthobacteraceae bacterium]|nr:hypothetical protein [Xanthobacteraceae bacterium]QYK44457.1 MAG: hypothetical protein KF794_11840 [Xanthobacteraceae bacterium]